MDLVRLDDAVGIVIVAGGGFSQEGGNKIMGIAALGLAAAAGAGLVLFRRDRKDDALGDTELTDTELTDTEKDR